MLAAHVVPPLGLDRPSDGAIALSDDSRPRCARAGGQFRRLVEEIATALAYLSLPFLPCTPLLCSTFVVFLVFLWAFLGQPVTRILVVCLSVAPLGGEAGGHVEFGGAQVPVRRERRILALR